jgi:hypothetical protein
MRAIQQNLKEALALLSAARAAARAKVLRHDIHYPAPPGSASHA